MTSSEKIRVAVLYGGRSPEHEVSVNSAANVMQHLDPILFDIVPIGIDKQGNWRLGNDILTQSLERQAVPSLQDSHHAWFTPEWVGKSEKKQELTDIMTVRSASRKQFDVIFPVVHGTYCEDGTLQGLLELANIPYVGCGVLASSVGMDKDISKRLAIQSGIYVAPYLSIKRADWQKKQSQWLSQIPATLGFPVFVKPANAGSSIGISKIKTAATLKNAIEHAFTFDSKVLVEKGLNVIELEVAVLEALDVAAEPMVSVVGEVRSSHEFYSYEAKYVDSEGAELFIPAAIPEAVQTEARAMARSLFQTLECEGLARVDLFYDKDTEQLSFNEINTLPGFTSISMYPKLMAASGIAYTELLTHLVQLAIKRHAIKSQLLCSYAR
ncbi:MAG: D-alanine--D-alanine ligase A [Gammaproteobacteria bacterium RIFCSPHIGHO2_12_FULL_45_12]|nr:MAG: D-alanine--D-alanine ligase A [Gammaproteobacteria bacterium RIFCSPHIGHO2_12_FULL_45_12]